MSAKEAAMDAAPPEPPEVQVTQVAQKDVPIYSEWDRCLPQLLMDTEEILSKPHDAGAQRPVTHLYEGISACLAGRFGAFIPP
jgi:hypothetical protein